MLHKENSTITLLIILCLLSNYFFYLITFSVNAPNGDDFYCIYQAVVNYNAAHTVSAKLIEIITPWLEHTIAYTKLLAIANYKLLGTLNFKIYIVIGNLSLVGIAFIFYKVLRKLLVPVWYYIPIAFLLFQQQSYEGQYWPAATAAYMSVIFFSMTCFYFVFISENKLFLLGLLFGTMALYTFGSGIITLLIVLGVLLLKRNYKKAALWTMCIMVVYFVFNNFYTYPKASRPPIFSSLLNNPEYVFNYFFAFSGMILDFDEAIKAPNEVIGIIGFGFLLWVGLLFFLLSLLIKHFKNFTFFQKSPFWFLVALSLFIFGSHLSMALLRGEKEMIHIFSSRYKIYPLILFITIYLSALLYFKNSYNKKLILACAITLFSILFNITSQYIYTYKIVTLRNEFLAGMYNWHKRMFKF